MNGISDALQTRGPCAPSESPHQPLCQLLLHSISSGIFVKPPARYTSALMSALLIYLFLIPAHSPPLCYSFIYLCFKSHNHSLKTVSFKVIILASCRQAPTCFSGASHLHLTYCSCLVVHLLGPSRYAETHVLIFHSYTVSFFHIHVLIHTYKHDIWSPVASPFSFFIQLCNIFCLRIDRI